jgi:hypothetical protein
MITLKCYHEKGGYNGGHLVVPEINRADRSILLSDFDRRSFFWTRTLENFRRYVNLNSDGSYYGGNRKEKRGLVD